DSGLLARGLRSRRAVFLPPQRLVDPDEAPRDLVSPLRIDLADLPELVGRLLEVARLLAQVRELRVRLERVALLQRDTAEEIARSLGMSLRPRQAPEREQARNVVRRVLQGGLEGLPGFGRS